MCAGVDDDQRLVVKDGGQRADPSSRLGPVCDRGGTFAQVGFDVAGDGRTETFVRHDGDQGFEPVIHVEPGHGDTCHRALVDTPAPPGRSGQRPHQARAAGTHRFGQRPSAGCFGPEFRHHLVEHHGFRGTLRQHVDESRGGRTPLDAGARQNRGHGEVPAQTRQQRSEGFHGGRQALGATCLSGVRKPLQRGSVSGSGAGLHVCDEFVDQAGYLREHEGTLAGVTVRPEPLYLEQPCGRRGQTNRRLQSHPTQTAATTELFLRRTRRRRRLADRREQLDHQALDQRVPGARLGPAQRSRRPQPRRRRHRRRPRRPRSGGSC